MGMMANLELNVLPFSNIKFCFPKSQQALDNQKHLYLQNSGSNPGYATFKSALCN